MTVIRHQVKNPGNEWREMEDLVMALKIDKLTPQECRFHASYPLDLSEAFEQWSGVPVTFCSQPELQVQL